MAQADFYFNPFDPEFRANPYPHYPALLDGPPRQLNLFMPTTIVARYDDVVSVLHDHERFTVRRPEMPFRERIDPFGGAPTILTADPPVHSRLRKLVSKAFTPRRVRELEPRVREITAELLSRASDSSSGFEAMAALANPLPVIVIAELLGVSADDHAQFKQWSNDMISSFGQENVVSGPSPEGVAARNELRRYLADAIKQRRANPGDDLISALITARDESDALSEDELLAFVVLLLLAGNETTTNLIGNGLLALCRHPEQQDRLRQNRALIPSAIEEMLRYDPPVQMTVRIPTAAANIGGTEIGSLAFILLAAATRDPAHFPSPEKFDIAREPNEHVSFGEGIHFCLGAPLARLEGAIAIEAMLEKFPRLQLANPDAKLEYRGSMALRGLSELRLSAR